MRSWRSTTRSEPTPLVELVAAHLAERGLTGADVDELLFTSESGAPLDYANWRRRVWLPAARAAAVEGAGFHDLRRANATALVASNVDLKTAQTRLGHSDPRLTLAVYAHATSESDRGAADALGAWFTDSADFSRTESSSATVVSTSRSG
jgi:integrase